MSRNIVKNSFILLCLYSSYDVWAIPPIKITLTDHTFDRHYENSNHLHNVLAVYSDKKSPTPNPVGTQVESYKATITETNDYLPFGLVNKERSYSSKTYRHNFNGKETDPETQNQDYGFRIYNPALGKFLSIDPLAASYPFLTPYQFASNTPIQAIDLDGLEAMGSITLGTDVEYRGRRMKLIHSNTKHISFTPTSSGAGHKPIFRAMKKLSSSDPEGIGFLTIFSHGIRGKLYGDNGNFNIAQENLNELKLMVEKGDIKFAEGAIIYLGGCNLGTSKDLYDENYLPTGKHLNFAEDLAAITGASVIAGSASVGPKDETGLNMIFNTTTPNTHSFFMFHPDRSTSDLKGVVDVHQYEEMALNNIATIKEEKRIQALRADRAKWGGPIQNIPSAPLKPFNRSFVPSAQPTKIENLSYSTPKRPGVIKRMMYKVF